MTSRSRFSAVLGCAIALSALFVSPALAEPEMPCIVPVLSTDGGSGLAGTALTLSGKDFGQGEVVQLKWNAQGQSSPDAPVIGTATGPTFSVAVTVPEAATDGHYWIVAITASDQTFNAAMDFYVGDPAPAEAAVETPAAPQRPSTDVGAEAEPPTHERQGKWVPELGPKPVRSAPKTDELPAPSAGTAREPELDGRAHASVGTPISARPRAVPSSLATSAPAGGAPMPLAVVWNREPLDIGATETAGDAPTSIERSDGPVSARSSAPGVDAALATGVALLALGSVLLFGGFFLVELLRRGDPVSAEDGEEDIWA